MASAGGKFSCEQCGKSYVWKPAHVGKKARCACGATIAVPQAPSVPAADQRALIPPITQAPAVAVVGGVPAARQTLQYNRGRDKKELASDKLYDAMRDIYVPVGLLVAGFLGMLLWGLLAVDRGPRMSVIVLMAAGTSTAIKTLVLVGLGLLLATKVGVSFGTFWSALLKFSAIIIFTDVLLLWLEEIMRSTGAIDSRGRGSVWILVLELMGATAVIAMLLNYLFDMDREETVWVAGPIAFASMVVGFILRFALLAALKAILAPAAATPPPPAAAGTTATTAPAVPTPIDTTARDREISSRVGERNPFIKDVSQWDEQSRLRGRGQKELLERLLEAGVKKIYHDMQGTLGLGGKLYVQLPLDPAGRAACIQAYTSYCETAGVPVVAQETKDQGQRYLVIELKR